MVLYVTKPILVGWSAGAHTCLGYIKRHGIAAISVFISRDMPPSSLSFEKDSWSEGSLDEISAVHTLYLRDARGYADSIKMYTEDVLTQRTLTAEELNWVMSLSLK